MALYKATIEVLLDVENEAEACDAMAEAIRPMLREFNRDAEYPSTWIDWRYTPNGHPDAHNGSGFEYQA